MRRPAFSFTLSLLFIITSSGYGQSLNNHQELFSAARQKQFPVLLVFSGSDWCLPCQWLEKRILTDSSFRDFARQNLLIIKADFPQRKKLSDEEKSANQKLAEEFNPQGVFPLLMLLKPERTVLTLLEYENYTPEDFIHQIKDALQNNGMLKEFGIKAKLMGSAFEFIVTAQHASRGNELLTECISEVKRIEQLLTEFRDDSETALINLNAGIQPVKVSDETYSLIQRSLHISSMTQGAFDITSGVLKKLYDFRRKEVEIPALQNIETALQKTGYKKIKLLPGNKVFLAKKGMHIGFGAIGKGYAADKVKNLMMEKAMESGVINASGDLTAWGTRPNGEPWKAGIAHPDKNEQVMVWLPLNGASIATSGDYEQFFILNGIRYSHNIDPKTGLPSRGIKSVTVVSPGAELSDALATAVTIMGIKAGLHLINQLPQTHCMIVDDKNQLHSSENININVTA